MELALASLPEGIQYFLSVEAVNKGLQLKSPRELDAGIDLPALENVTLSSGELVALRTGVHLAIPQGWVGLIRDRSGIALKGGITLAGVIDAGYRGEVKVVMHNISNKALSFKTGDRIAQCIIIPHWVGTNLQQVQTLDLLGQTVRNQDGFGSTGA